MVWKKVINADTGDSDHFGGDDVDKISDLFSGVDIDDVILNADTEVQKGLVIKSQTEPSSPASGKVILYVDSADNKIKIKRSNGDVVIIE